MVSSIEKEMVGVTSQAPPQKAQSKAGRWYLLFLSITLMALGYSAQILGKIYFLHGGKQLWLSSLVQICGWPIALVPLSISYAQRCHQVGLKSAKIIFVTPRIVTACVVLGLANGFDCYLYSYGTSYLPVSTSALLASTRLAFNALFALLIVKQRFTPYSINSVVLLLFGAVILGLASSGARPVGQSNASYNLGFFMTLGAAALNGLLFPLIELTYMRIGQKLTNTLVMEIQVLISIFGTLFCIGGMLVSNDLQAIPREARGFGLGEVKYYVVLVATAVLWQLFNLGFVSVISCSSSLFAGIVTAVLLPVIELLAVIILHETFDSGKGISLALSFWGFSSYFYGEWKQYQKTKTNPRGLELPAVP